MQECLFHKKSIEISSSIYNSLDIQKKHDVKFHTDSVEWLSLLTT